MSDSINEQRCEHGKTADDAHERNGDTCFHPFECFDRCPGPSVVTPPAQDEPCDYYDAVPEGYHVVEDLDGERLVPSPAAPSVSTDHTDEQRADVQAKATEVLSKHFHGGQWDDVAELIAEAVYPKGAER